MKVLLSTVVMLLAGLVSGCSYEGGWRCNWGAAIRDESSTAFQVVLDDVSRSNSGEFVPIESIIRRVDGKTGRELAVNRSWRRPEPRPDVVFGWKDEFVLYDGLLATFVRSKDVLTRTSPDHGSELPLSQKSGALRHLNVPGGGKRTSSGTVPTTVDLLRIYPTPIVGPRQASGPFSIFHVNLESMEARSVSISQAAEEVLVKGQHLLVRLQGDISAYSLEGKQLWRAKAEKNEQLRTGPFEDEWRQTRMTMGDAEVFVTSTWVRGVDDSKVIVRGAGDGHIRWQKPMARLTADLADATSSFVIFVGAQRYNSENVIGLSGSPEVKWIVWDASGKEVGTGSVEPDDLGIAADPASAGLAIGSSQKSTLFHRAESRTLTGLPGRPVLLHGDSMLCQRERSIFFVDLQKPEK